jgi:hypothetical protein
VNLGGGSSVLTSYWVYQGTSLPFDIAHALGNFGFCMLAGPILLRMLRRTQRRSELTWPESPQSAPTAADSAAHA